jgi:glycerophosphoryl diester phosphodiesterase
VGVSVLPLDAAVEVEGFFEVACASIAMPGLDWLTARPVAHRGLHDASAGIIENTASAVVAAVAAGYGIEVDLQISRDGEAMVHHDDALGRLAEGDGRLDRMTASVLATVPFKATSDRMLTLGQLLDLVAGRSTLFLELKSQFDHDRRLPARVADVVRAYAGPVAVMSFDPWQMEALQEVAPGLPRGIVGQRTYRRDGKADIGARDKLAHVVRGLRSRPHFIAYNVNDLPAPAPLAGRYMLGLPLLTWTVRSPQERRRAERWADQMIFEGFRP